MEVLPAYWGIETLGRDFNFHHFHLIWKYYPPTGVLKLDLAVEIFKQLVHYLEVLPAYWGIETQITRGLLCGFCRSIWKYYPPTGVLKLLLLSALSLSSSCYLEVLPAYWGIETFFRNQPDHSAQANLEVLPAYWGIETICQVITAGRSTHIWKYYPPTGVLKPAELDPVTVRQVQNLEVLPAYWGIETPAWHFRSSRSRPRIWKYYPPTGVLKLIDSKRRPNFCFVIWKYYPPTGVLKLFMSFPKGGIRPIIWKYYPPTGVLKPLRDQH